MKVIKSHFRCSRFKATDSSESPLWKYSWILSSVNNWATCTRQSLKQLNLCFSNERFEKCYEDFCGNKFEDVFAPPLLGLLLSHIHTLGTLTELGV